MSAPGSTSDSWAADRMTMSKRDWAALNRGEIVIVRRGIEVIAAVWDGDDGKEKANANLIAAAPELFATLKWFIDDIDGSRTSMWRFDENVKADRTAIAKATGAA